jgi:hypothetical protein
MMNLRINCINNFVNYSQNYDPRKLTIYSLKYSVIDNRINSDIITIINTLINLHNDCLIYVIIVSTIIIQVYTLHYTDMLARKIIKDMKYINLDVKSTQFSLDFYVKCGLNLSKQLIVGTALL